MLSVILSISLFWLLKWKQKTYLTEQRGWAKVGRTTSLTAQSNRQSPKSARRSIAPLYIIFFKDMQDKKALKWRGKPINSLSSTVNQKISADQTWIKKRMTFARFFSSFLMTGVSIKVLSVTFPVFSCTPLCLDHSAHWVASQRSIPLPLSAFTRHSLLLLLLLFSLPLIHSITLSSCLSLFHILTSPDWS